MTSFNYLMFYFKIKLHFVWTIWKVKKENAVNAFSRIQKTAKFKMINHKPATTLGEDI